MGVQKSTKNKHFLLIVRSRHSPDITTKPFYPHRICRTQAIRLTISLIKSGDSLKSFGGYTYYILPLQLIIRLNV